MKLRFWCAVGGGRCSWIVGGALTIAALIGVAACSSSSPSSSGGGCVEGASSPCACANGASGSQECSGGAYGACSCEDASGDGGSAPDVGDAGVADARDPDAVVSCLAPTCTLGTGTNKGTCTCVEQLTECAVSEITGHVIVPASNGCDEYQMAKTTLDEPDTFVCCAEGGYASASATGATPTAGARCQCNPWYCHDQPAGSTYNCVCAVTSATPSDGTGCEGTTCCMSDLGGSCECAARAIACPSGYHSVAACSLGYDVTTDDICPKGWSEVSSSITSPTSDTLGCHANFAAGP